MDLDLWILEAFGEPLVRFLFWVALLPPVLVIATPGVLTASFFGEQRYWLNVYVRYAAVIRWWRGLLRYV
ncbi:MAG: hypothetical protein ACO1SX_23240 [Actinomycetota bacterium]